MQQNSSKNKIKYTFLMLSVLCGFTFSSAYAFADEESGPEIILRSTVRMVEAGKTVKITATFSEPVTKFTKDRVSVDGGVLETLRKLSPQSYLLFVRAEANVKEIDVQVESSKVQNSKKIFNTYASNNLLIKVKTPPPPAAESQSATEISKLLDKMEKSSAINNPAPTAQPIQQQITYKICNGYTIPSNQPCQPQNNTSYRDAYVNTYYYPGTTPYPSTYPPYNSYYDDEEEEVEVYYVAPKKKSYFFFDW